MTKTGPLKIGDDWTGIFIRGDDALAYANKLRLIAKRCSMSHNFLLAGLIELLESCREQR